MPLVLVLAGIGAMAFLYYKLSAPWRRYHEQHVAPLEEKLKAIHLNLVEKERELGSVSEDASLFCRDFRSEVQRHQAAKDDAYARLNPLNEKKSQLHDELSDVRSRLDSWHRNSKSFFGNKAQKIKDDSFLGWFGIEQTVAQKESLERRRSTLSTEISDLKGQASEIFETEIKPAKDGIKAAHDDQKRLDAFRRQGKSSDFFRSKTAALNVEILALKIEISGLETAIRTATEGYKRNSR